MSIPYEKGRYVTNSEIRAALLAELEAHYDLMDIVSIAFPYGTRLQVTDKKGASKVFTWALRRGEFCILVDELKGE